MIEKRHAKRIIVILLVTFFIISTALCEHPVWDCPECGRTGNTGNYCGGCAHPAPWLETITFPPTSTPSTIPTTIPTPTVTPAPTSRLQGFKTIGGVVTFGHYEQDNNTTNGLEEIEWLVLDVQGGKALLISRLALELIPYNKKWTAVTWEKCSLRKWLNNDFLKNAFSADEQKAIILTSVDNSNDQHMVSNDVKKNIGGNNTKDRVFVLSLKEAMGFFFKADAKFDPKCYPSDYTEKKLYDYWYRLFDVNPENDPDPESTNRDIRIRTELVRWWFRSPLEPFDNMSLNNYVHGACVDPGVKYYVGDFQVNDEDVCVRPVLWVDLSADIF